MDRKRIRYRCFFISSTTYYIRQNSILVPYFNLKPVWLCSENCFFLRHIETLCSDSQEWLQIELIKKMAILEFSVILASKIRFAIQRSPQNRRCHTPVCISHNMLILLLIYIVIQNHSNHFFIGQSWDFLCAPAPQSPSY